MNRLKGKIALVTGGNSGIGLATARLFSQEGANVVITGRDQQSLDQAKSSLNGDHTAVQTDARDLPAVDALYAQIKNKYGALDILFANAGIGGSAMFVEKITEAVYDEMFDINVKGVFFTVQKALPLLRPGGSIILNSSIAARIGRPGQALYGATKAAVKALARGFSSETIARGIRVNVISPGPIDTPIWERSGRPIAEVEAVKKYLQGNIPVGRFGLADEVAQAVCFLASDDSKFIVGAEITIDGGVTEIRAVRPAD